ncbi:M48 family metallopeptidase [Methylopila sp. M107]|uniref:M48 family metallopeptidase n=1 Tax=Methylopila sp. M107 TaxID=1101190 RepID=UPI00036A6852|nr:M48 family metallopeptidase [Methylopila sp. M107]
MATEPTVEQYHGWIQAAEREATANPAAYRRKVGLFAALGYAYVFTLLAVVAMGVAGIVFALFFREGAGAIFALAKLGVILLIFGGMIVSALWVTFDEPQGTPVDAGKFPTLVAEIDDLRKRLATIPIHRTIIVPEFNAFVSQTPRLGVFGWQRNTLALGLELMLTLSPQEMRAVIAHELGHLSRNHSKFSGWIYRVRRTWANLFVKFKENTRLGAGLINRFFYWYIPRFDAYSFALRRQNEYEADAASAELTSRETAGAALVKVDIIGAHLNHRYWRDFYAQTLHSQEPQRMAFAALAHDLRAVPLDPDHVAGYRQSALAQETGFEDTHPSLVDRLKGLGLEPASFAAIPLDLSASAAVEWLGAELPRLIAEFDEAWWRQNGDGWRSRHQELQDELAEMRDLSARPAQSLEDMQLWRLGALTARHVGEAEALNVFRTYQMRVPGDFDANIVIGRFLRNADDAGCLDEWRAIPRDHAGFVEANVEAAEFLEARGRSEEAARHLAVARERAAERQSSAA